MCTVSTRNVDNNDAGSGFFVNRLARRTAATLKMGFSDSAFQQVSRVGDDKHTVTVRIPESCFNFGAQRYHRKDLFE